MYWPNHRSQSRTYNHKQKLVIHTFKFIIKPYTIIYTNQQKFSTTLLLTLIFGVSEWVSVCCLTPIQQFCSAISWREHVYFKWDGDEVRIVLYQHAELDLYTCSAIQQAHWNNSPRVDKSLHSDSEPNSLCPFSLMLRV